MPVIPATQEAEAGELPEPRRRRLRWAGIAPLYSSLGNKSETPSQKKKSLNEIQEKVEIQSKESSKSIQELKNETATLRKSQTTSGMEKFTTRIS